MPLGDGTDSDYPGNLDTAQTFTNGASPVADDSTRIDAEVINDVLDCILKIESELGTNPSGSYGDVKTRLNNYLPLSGAAFSQGSVVFADANGRLSQDNSGIRFGPGLQLGSPTGGDQGAGTLNAVGVYDDGSLLTCYPLEYAVAGKIDLKKWDATIPGGHQHARARDFVKRAKRDLDIELYINYWRAHRHLPAMPSPEEWARERPGLGDLQQRMWETIEVQAIHIAELYERLKDLENERVK